MFELEPENGICNLSKTETSNFRWIHSDWTTFTHAYRSWIQEQGSEPIFRLPEPAIDLLAKPSVTHPPLLATDRERAERAFLDLCRYHHAIGFYCGKPLVCAYLDERLPLEFPGVELSPWYRERMPLAQRLVEEHCSPAYEWSRGYVGWLWTEPAYLEELNQLQEFWKQLPTELQMNFPLHNHIVTSPKTLKSGSARFKRLERFGFMLSQLCDRWSLTGLGWWTLPQPQGPLMSSPPSPRLPSTPRNLVEVVIPPSYPLPSGDRVLHHMQAEQEQRARELELPPSAAGLPHWKAYARMAEIIHLETVITDRSERLGRRRGFVSMMVEAIAEAVGLTVDQVKKHRKAINACRRGQREQVDRLHVGRR